MVALRDGINLANIRARLRYPAKRRYCDRELAVSRDAEMRHLLQLLEDRDRTIATLRLELHLALTGHLPRTRRGTPAIRPAPNTPTLFSGCS